MRLGICHQVSLPGAWEDAIATAGQLGVEGIELFVRAEDVPAFLESPETARSLKVAAQRAGVQISSLGLIFSFRGDALLSDPATRQTAVARVADGIRRCADAGGDVVLVGGVPEPADAAAMDAYVASVRELVPVAREHGIRIGLECGLGSADVLAMLDRVGSPEVVGDYYDMGNLAGRGMDPVEEARLRRGRIAQVHAKGVRGAGLDAGTVDLAAVRDALRAGGFDGWLLLETSAGDDPVGNARRNLAVLREAFGL
jgi:sugar phosphate isomerase/epimerase